MYLLWLFWLFWLWYCSKCLAVMNCSAVALWYCSMNKSDSLFYCFILMIIVKKIQIPNIFYRFSKKYYYCHNFHSISADLPGFWQKYLNLYQKTVFFDHRILKKYHFYPYFCIFFVLKWRKWRKWRIYYCMWEKIYKIYRVEWKNKKNIYT